MITETRLVYFRHNITKDGTLSAESFFKIRSDADNADDARSDAEQWAGEIGSPLKIGGGGQNTFQFHTNMILEAVEINELANEFVFDVRLSGVPKTETWQMLPGSERTESGGIVTEKVKYFYCGDTLPDFPHEGDTVNNDDGKTLICTSSALTNDGNDRRTLSLIFKSLTPATVDPDIPEETVSRIKYVHNGENMRCIADFFWSRDVYNSEMAALRFFDESYVPSWAGAGFVLEKMDSEIDGSLGFDVTLTAVKIETKLISVNCSEENDNKVAEAVYEVRKSEKSSFDDLLGTSPVFVSGDYIVTAVSSRELNNALLRITVKAEERKNLTCIGDVVSECNHDGISRKRIKFYISEEEAPSFRESLKFGAYADWAGENYYLNSFTEKENQQGFFFELEAVEIYTRMLSISQEEKFAGSDPKGAPRREVIYKSVWQVAPEDIGDFTDISGQNAAWSNDDAIITSVKPKKLSDIEYEVEIEAQRRSNSSLQSNYKFTGNYENLSSRVDLDCELVDFRLSPKDCGYFINSDGMHEILSGWRPENECPFSVRNVLHPRFINAILKILRISETTYEKGNMAKNISDMIEWGETRVFNGKVGGHNGSYIKSDLEAEEIYDNHGDIWTKITRVYDLAPFNVQWNQYYFRKFN